MFVHLERVRGDSVMVNADHILKVCANPQDTAQSYVVFTDPEEQNMLVYGSITAIQAVLNRHEDDTYLSLNDMAESIDLIRTVLEHGNQGA